MEEIDPQPNEPSDPAAEPAPERTDAAGRAGDLEAMAAAALDATFGETEAGRVRVPGVLSGDLGPKGEISAQMRALSRAERSVYGEVPHGSVVSGGGRYLLLPLLAFAVVLLGLVGLLGWLAR